MGYSFAAGTVDGPGAFSFKQGTLSTNPTWNIVRNILASPTENDILCQAPKPILLATGRVSKLLHFYIPFPPHPHHTPRFINFILIRR